MAGGLISVIAYGTQDLFLTGNPQITFFKTLYRRYSHFALESIEQTFTGNPDFNKKVNIQVTRNADLIGRTYLRVTLPALTASGSGCSWVNEIGHQLIKNVSVDIGGQEIDKHYAEWFTIWNSLTLPTGQLDGYNQMIGNVAGLTGAFPAHAVSSGNSTEETVLYVPLVFTWNRLPAIYLPMVALQFQDVRITVEFRNVNECIRGTYSGSTPQLGETSLWVDYVYLDSEERRLFARGKHEYLVEQLQYQGEESLNGTNNKVKLAFNHPVKELYWVVARNDNMDTSVNTYMDWTNFTDKHVDNDGDNPVLTSKLLLNGQERFAPRDGKYFRLIQHYQNHTNSGIEGLNVYSFAIHPEEHQPSGTTNFSRIDNASLNVVLTSAMSGVDATIKVFVFSYNILRVASGLGGLAFAS